MGLTLATETVTYVYTELAQKWHLFICLNFIKYWPIFKTVHYQN